MSPTWIRGASDFGCGPIPPRAETATIIVVAEKEELTDKAQNGGKVHEIVKAKGNVPLAYHEIKGISHYGVHGGETPTAAKPTRVIEPPESRPGIDVSRGQHGRSVSAHEPAATR